MRRIEPLIRSVRPGQEGRQVMRRGRMECGAHGVVLNDLRLVAAGISNLRLIRLAIVSRWGNIRQAVWCAWLRLIGSELPGPLRVNVASRPGAVAAVLSARGEGRSGLVGRPPAWSR